MTPGNWSVSDHQGGYSLTQQNKSFVYIYAAIFLEQLVLYSLPSGALTT